MTQRHLRFVSMGGVVSRIETLIDSFSESIGLGRVQVQSLFQAEGTLAGAFVQSCGTRSRGASLISGAVPPSAARRRAASSGLMAALMARCYRRPVRERLV